MTENKYAQYSDDMDGFHYLGKVECIDLMEPLGIKEEDFCLGNVIKYIYRRKEKGTKIENLKKARWYLNRLIETLEENES